VLDCLLPPTCAVCLQVTAGPGGEAVCRDCQRRLGPAPVPFRIGELEVRAAFEHRGAGRALIHALKYGGRRDVAGVISGSALAGFEQYGWPGCELLVPVPLHPRRQRRRGYNQSHVLARALGELLGLEVIDGLRRVRSTISQTRLSATERHENLREAFAPGRRADIFRGRSVLLVDDVVTTGATLLEAARVLRRTGAQRIVGQVAARAEMTSPRNA
jgi:ComF family protein